MFATARVRLTIWYLCIIMLISIMFSLAIYRTLTQELDRQATRITERYTREFGFQPSPAFSEPQMIQTSEQRILFTLLYVNVIIFVISGVGGYILAGVTLRPIEEMISEQNRFITDASHELKTPITTLKSEIEVYLRQKHHTEKDAHQLIASNLEEANSLQALSDSLFELAQYKKSKYVTAFSHTAIIDVITAAVKTVSKMARQKKIAITQEVGKYMVYGNAEQLTKLFTILFDNAIKYSSEDTTITVSSEQADGHIKIVLTDHGIGIDEKDLPHIFDRFYRADSSRTKQQIPGYGLGLSIAQKIVHEHHGNIQVKSAVGIGTTFSIQLPTGA